MKKKQTKIKLWHTDDYSEETSKDDEAELGVPQEEEESIEDSTIGEDTATRDHKQKTEDDRSEHAPKREDLASIKEDRFTPEGDELVVEEEKDHSEAQKVNDEVSPPTVDKGRIFILYTHNKNNCIFSITFVTIIITVM